VNFEIVGYQTYIDGTQTYRPRRARGNDLVICLGQRIARRNESLHPLWCPAAKGLYSLQ
jgi:hypothetical protein